jgi:hypothetical protein
MFVSTPDSAELNTGTIAATAAAKIIAIFIKFLSARQKLQAKTG